MTDQSPALSADDIVAAVSLATISLRVNALTMNDFMTAFSESVEVIREKTGATLADNPLFELAHAFQGLGRTVRGDLDGIPIFTSPSA